MESCSVIFFPLRCFKLCIFVYKIKYIDINIKKKQCNTTIEEQISAKLVMFGIGSTPTGIFSFCDLTCKRFILQITQKPVVTIRVESIILIFIFQIQK